MINIAKYEYNQFVYVSRTIENETTFQFLNLYILNAWSHK